MENSENLDMKAEVFKLQKKSPFKNMKKKPMIIALIVAGSILLGAAAIGGYGIISSLNTSKFEIKFEDYEKAFGQSRDPAINDVTYKIRYCSLSSDETAAYNITAVNGQDLYIHPDNATLIDTDPTGKAPVTNQLKEFKNAIVNKIDETDDIIIETLALTTIKDQPVYIQTVGDNREVISINNSVVYREIKESELKKFTNEASLDTVYFDLGGGLVKFTNFIGERDVVINDIKLIGVALMAKDGKYYEYLSTPKQLIFTGTYKDGSDFLDKFVQDDCTLRVLSTNMTGYNKPMKIKSGEWNTETGFVLIRTTDDKVIKLSPYNGLFISKNSPNSVSDNAEYNQMIVGFNDSTYVEKTTGVYIAPMAGVYNSYGIINKEKDEIAVGIENAIPVRKLDATSVEAGELNSYILFEEPTTCTIKTNGIEDMFTAVGYKINTFGEAGKPFEVFAVLRKVNDSYYEYNIVKNGVLFQSRELNIGRDSVKTK